MEEALKSLIFASSARYDASVLRQDLPARLADYVSNQLWVEHCNLYMSLSEYLPLGPPGQQTRTMQPDDDGIDLALEIWGDGDLDNWVADLPLHVASAYSVEEVVEKGSRHFAPGPIPGVAFISRVVHKPGLSRQEFRAGYDRHPITALRVHIGMDRYVRNIVDDDTSPVNSPSCDGISVLNFPTEDDLVERLYVNASGVADIANDVATFLDAEKVRSMQAHGICLK